MLRHGEGESVPVALPLTQPRNIKLKIYVASSQCLMTINFVDFHLFHISYGTCYRFVYITQIIVLKLNHNFSTLSAFFHPCARSCFPCKQGQKVYLS